MNLPAWISVELIGIAVLLLFLFSMIAIAIFLRDRDWRSMSITHLRNMQPFTELRNRINFAVEAGQGLHLTFGWGKIGGVNSISALAGLSMLRRIAEIFSLSDKQPIASSGDGTITILSQDTMHEVYRNAGQADRYNPLSGQVSGLTPFSYAVGTLPMIYDQKFPTNILIGHFGVEATLIADASENSNSQTLAGSEDLATQSILYASASDPLIGEELFAGGAYLGSNLMHYASLLAQDIVRWLLVIIILAGIALKVTGKL